MRFSSLLPVCLLLAVAVPSEASRMGRGPTAKHKSAKAAKAAKANAATAHQRAIDDGRATQIQGALVKAGYLKEVTGHWDSSSEAAMQKLQADNGWQTKIVPDSRALIKLGLGPNAGVAQPFGVAEADAAAGTP